MYRCRQASVTKSKRIFFCTVNNVPNLSQHTAWILATRPVFMYPELLPVCALKPKGPQDRVFFTKAEDK